MTDTTKRNRLSGAKDYGKAKANKASGRDYTRDKIYQSSPEQVANRMKRNAARKMYLSKNIVKLGDNKDIDHKKPLSKGGGNSKSNLRVIARSVNRAKKS